jgi:hypothetical protein
VSHDLLKHPLLSQAIEKAYHEFSHPKRVRVETKHNIMNISYLNISKDDMTFSFNKTHQHMQTYNPLFSFWAMPRIVTLNKSTD